MFIAFRNATNERLNQQTVFKSGVGTGLSNSKCLVEALGGTIDLQSKPNKGTIVTFSVDLVLGKEKEMPASSVLKSKVAFKDDDSD